MEESHPMAARKQLSIEELASERFIVVPNSVASPGYGTLYALCQRAGFEPNIVQEVESISSMLNLVSVDMGIGLCVIGKHFSYPRPIRMVPLRGLDYSTRFVVAWLKGHRIPLVQNLLDAVESAVDPA